jgi:serine/threonine protein kinase
MGLKLQNYSELQYPSSISQQAKHLISCLCQKKISARYTAKKALLHPFITRNLDEDLPLTMP